LVFTFAFRHLPFAFLFPLLSHAFLCFTNHLSSHTDSGLSRANSLCFHQYSGTIPKPIFAVFCFHQHSGTFLHFDPSTFRPLVRLRLLYRLQSVTVINYYVFQSHGGFQSNKAFCFINIAPKWVRIEKPNPRSLLISTQFGFGPAKPTIVPSADYPSVAFCLPASAYPLPAASSCLPPKEKEMQAATHPRACARG